MSFSDLPQQSPIFPAEAESYAEISLKRSHEAQQRCRTELDVAYGSDYWQKVDIYMPEAEATNCPVVVFAHGGAWTHGYKEWMGLMAPPLVAEGVIFVSVSYRLSPETKHPGPMEDCAAALGWVVKNIAKFGGNPQRIIVGGHSAGGHLYALVAMREELLARYGVPSDAIVACAPLSAQMDLQFAELPKGSAEERVHAMLLNSSDDAGDASPVNLVHPRVPYMLLSYGTEDFPRIIRGYQSMMAAMDPQCEYECMALEGRGHFDTALELGDSDNPWVRKVISLLRAGPAS